LDGNDAINTYNKTSTGITETTVFDDFTAAYNGNVLQFYVP
jgi:hypothetical protein